MEEDAYLKIAAVEVRHWWFVGRRRIIAAAIGRLKLKPNARILELGCGTGGNLAMLTRFGKVTAVEMSETARTIAMARSTGAVILPGMLPDQLPLHGKTYDLICLLDVLEHIAEDEATLAAVRDLLAPGGLAIITVPAYAALFGPADVMAHHHRRYERAGLRKKLLHAEFSIEKLSFINAALLPLALLVRWSEKVRPPAKPNGFTIPPFPVNGIFAALFSAETLLLSWADLPFGLSLLAVIGHPASDLQVASTAKADD